jgi:hypothetical protein
MHFFPFSKTLLLHDWNVVSHELGWSRLDDAGALLNQETFKETIVQSALALRPAGGRFLTYQTFPRHHFAV